MKQKLLGISGIRTKTIADRKRMDKMVIFPYFRLMLAHRSMLLVVLFTALTLVSNAQSDPKERLTLPSSTLKGKQDATKTVANDKNYNFDSKVVEEFSELPPTRYDVKGSALFFSKNHSFQVENNAEVPLLRAEDLDGLLFIYQHRDVTPFVRDNGGAQVELVHNLDCLRTDLELTDDLAFKSIAGYEYKGIVDRTGTAAGYKAGLGIGTPYEKELEDFRWQVMVGGFLKSDNLRSNWFVDVDTAYRVTDLCIGPWKDNKEFKPSILLELSEQSTNHGGSLHYYVESGPTLEIMSLNGNRFSFYAHFFRNSNNEFQMANDRGMMVGIRATTFQNNPQPTNYDWDFVGVRWIPRMRGVAESGGSTDGFVHKMKLNLDAWDVNAFGQVVTVYGDYEHRQDYIKKFNSTSFSVAAGLKTYIEPSNDFLSVITDGQHLVPFGEFFHRSDHAIDVKDVSRLQPSTTKNGYLKRESLDNLQAGFQTIGWDNPNYRIEKYHDDTQFVNQWDWRTAVGYALSKERERPQPPASFGLNWDAFSVHGFVVYAQGIVSLGEASPDYIGELGIKRPGGSLFVRIENYGLPARLEDDKKPVYVGLGLNL